MFHAAAMCCPAKHTAAPGLTCHSQCQPFHTRGSCQPAQQCEGSWGVGAGRGVASGGIRAVASGQLVSKVNGALSALSEAQGGVHAEVQNSPVGSGLRRQDDDGQQHTAWLSGKVGAGCERAHREGRGQGRQVGGELVCGCRGSSGGVGQAGSGWEVGERWRRCCSRVLLGCRRVAGWAGGGSKLVRGSKLHSLSCTSARRTHQADAGARRP